MNIKFLKLLDRRNLPIGWLWPSRLLLETKKRILINACISYKGLTTPVWTKYYIVKKQKANNFHRYIEQFKWKNTIYKKFLMTGTLRLHTWSRIDLKILVTPCDLLKSLLRQKCDLNALQKYLQTFITKNGMNSRPYKEAAFLISMKKFHGQL